MSPVRSRTACAAIAALFFVSFGYVHRSLAQEEEAVVVTASRTEHRIREAIPHTTVLTRQDIRDAQVADLPSLLRREAGFEFSQSGGIGTTSSTFLRGASSNQVLVLVDGTRVSSLTTGASQLDQILLDQIERIEIVRGNVSSLYGSGAVGGVIQVFTRRGRGIPSAEFEAAAGGQRTGRLRTGFGGESDGTRYMFSFSRFQTDGFSAQRPENSPTTNPDRDGYFNDSWSASLAYRFSAAHEAGFSAFGSEGRVEYDDAFAMSAQDRQAAQTLLAAGSAYLDSRIGSNWRSRLTYALGRDSSEQYLNATRTGMTATRNRQLTWQNDFVVSSDQQITLGAEGLRQSVASTTAYVHDARDVDAAFAGYRGHFGRHSAQVNARWEDYSDFGAARTWYTGYGYDFTDSVRLTAARSTAFRAPTFNELYWPGFGNPNLRPERARNSELGVQYAHGPHLLRVVAFRSLISDLINPWPIVNLNEARISGVETSYRGRIAATDVQASLTRQNPTFLDASGEQDLLRRARIFGSLALGRTLGDWRLGAEVLASGRRYDNHVATFTRTELAPYRVVNLTANYRIGPMTELGMRIENAFNRQYTLAHGYNTQDRKLTAEMRARW
jgi:vitamin B12 transporter